VGLLNLYLGPEPKVASFVREQLITDEEESTIQKAVGNAAKGKIRLNSIYDRYLAHTSLNLQRVLEEVGMETVVGVMFDLNLGDRVRRLQLNRFSDVHEVRELVEGFVSNRRGGAVGSYAMGSIWWDGVDPLMTPHARWISVNLEEDRDFSSVFGKWLEDSEVLQDWLDKLGESPAVVNNGESGRDPVFCAKVAFQVMELAKVRSLLLAQAGI